MYHAILMILLMATVSPERDRPLKISPRLLPQKEAVLALDFLEVKPSDSGSEWTYLLTFNNPPTCTMSIKMTTYTMLLVDKVEKGSPRPGFCVEEDGADGLKIVIKALKTPSDPLVRKIVRVRGEELVTYDVTLGRVPAGDDGKRVAQFFLELAPNELIMKHNGNKPGKWTINVMSQHAKGSKSIRFTYEPKEAAPD